jgi:hypothetical protein
VHCDTSEQIDTAKDALKETGARDIASTGEEGSKETAGGRGTFGNISDGERLSTTTKEDDVLVSRESVTRVPTATKY